MTHRHLDFVYPTNEELAPFIGARWAIARKTAANIRKHAGARLLTRAEFQAAQDMAVAARSRPSNVIALRA